MRQKLRKKETETLPNRRKEGTEESEGSQLNCGVLLRRTRRRSEFSPQMLSPTGLEREVREGQTAEIAQKERGERARG